MPPAAQSHAQVRITDSPEVYAGSLAHILHREGGKVTVVGQAWLAGANKLITCGHVVEPFLNDTNSLLVKFPASGSEYSIDSISLHPDFGRQDDQLLKFDAAVISVRLRGPELASTALPICFGQDLKNQDNLWTVRYPAHLGALTSAPDPLQQTGHYLGRLRKQDNFHLLHDLALSPGDSGAALFSNQGVVAIHCGDTASLPGLNLPTTSIRLALLVDAFGEIGIHSTVPQVPPIRKRSTAANIAIGTVALTLTLAGCAAALTAIYQSQFKEIQTQNAAPIQLAFMPVSEGDSHIGSIHLRPVEPCRVYMVLKKGDDKTYVVYGRIDKVDNGDLDIVLPEDLRKDWQSGAAELLLITVKPSQKLLADSDLPGEGNGKTIPLVNDTKGFWERVKAAQQSGALCQTLSPQSTISSGISSGGNTNGSGGSSGQATGDVKDSADTGKGDSPAPDKSDDSSPQAPASADHSDKTDKTSDSDSNSSQNEKSDKTEGVSQDSGTDTSSGNQAKQDSAASSP
jgi:hypothetical protein